MIERGENMYQRICITAVTDQGSRKENQDNFQIDTKVPYIREDYADAVEMMEADEKIHFACVCDGIGGETLGRLAALSVLEMTATCLKNQTSEEELAGFVEKTMDHIARKLAQVYEKLKEQGGTTIAMFAWKQEQFWAVNIGDSPIYQIGEDRITELSEAHTLAGYKLSVDIVPEKGDEHILLNYIGKKELSGSEMMHTFKGTLHPGDKFFLCSDGISKCFDCEKIYQTVKEKGADSVAELTEQAAKAENSDNCTAMLIVAE